MADERMRGLPGRVVTFLIGRTSQDLEAAAEVEIKAAKSAPAYPDVLPRQKILRADKGEVAGLPVTFIVKAYLPHFLLVEASVDRADILAPDALSFKRSLLQESRKMLAQMGCTGDLDEEYTLYCIRDYSGDPTPLLATHGGRVAAMLKNETIDLDPEEVKSTLANALKYGREDITVVDWDGAFLFDAAGDFQSSIELFQIVNLQLLRLRMLDGHLDRRLQRTLKLLRAPKGLPLIRSREVRRSLKEIVEIRTESILEWEAAEHNIKLIGDWYSARLYTLISKRFHLDSWRADIKEKLDTLEDIYTMAAENFSISFGATLEFIMLAGWFLLLVLYLGEYFLLEW